MVFDLTLGDGYIQKPRHKNGNCFLRMNHSIKQKDYLLYKKTMLDEFGIPTHYAEYKSNEFQCCYVTTGRMKDITNLRNLLYVDGKKVLSNNLLDLFDKRTLSILFQDDGSVGIRDKRMRNVKGNIKTIFYEPYINQFVLNLQNFCNESCHLIKDKISSFGIESKINDRRGNVICINKYESKKKFFEIIQPYMHESMMYKVNYGFNAC